MENQIPANAAQGGGDIGLDDLKRMVEATEAWAASPAGQEALADAGRTVEETIAYLTRERAVTAEILNMTFDLRRI